MMTAKDNTDRIWSSGLLDLAGHSAFGEVANFSAPWFYQVDRGISWFKLQKNAALSGKEKINLSKLTKTFCLKSSNHKESRWFARRKVRGWCLQWGGFRRPAMSTALVIYNPVDTSPCQPIFYLIQPTYYFQKAEGWGAWLLSRQQPSLHPSRTSC